MWLFRSGFVLVAFVFAVAYTGFRLFRLIKYLLPSFKAFIFWPVYVIFGFSYIIASLLRLDRFLSVRLVVMYSLPFLIYFCMGLLIFEVPRFVLWTKKKKRFSSGVSAGFTGLAMGLTILVIIFGTFNSKKIHTTRYEITLNGRGSPGMEKALRIALVSDTHIGRIVNLKWLSKIVDAVIATNPDVICIAGDILDNNKNMISDIEGVAGELQRLSAPLGVYACQGNHDVSRYVWRDEREAVRLNDFLKAVGINFLQDEVVTLTENIYLIGRRDARVYGNRPPRKTAAEISAELDRSKIFIFMDHQPVDYPALDEAGADLIFSGHTHGGQFFPGNIVTALMFRKAGAKHYGHWRGKTAQAVISSGAGLWGPPIRIGTKSEVVVVDVRFISAD